METYYIQFENKISEKEVAFLRGVMLSRFPDRLLFHNHKDEKLRYAYPLIQYKRHRGCAGILGINEGCEELRKVKDILEQPCMLGSRPVILQVKSVKMEDISVRVTDTPVYYHISNWLPLNQENYREYQNQQFLGNRIQILEKVLVGNVLSFMKGIGMRIDDMINCRIVEITSQSIIPYKGVDLMSFGVTFQSNVILPEYIGLGKGASINHGTIISINYKTV